MDWEDSGVPRTAPGAYSFFLKDGCLSGRKRNGGARRRDRRAGEKLSSRTTPEKVRRKDGKRDEPLEKANGCTER